MAHDPMRRRDVQRMTPAELAIRNAIIEVEKVGASRELTAVVIKLDEASEKLADVIDAVE